MAFSNGLLVKRAPHFNKPETTKKNNERENGKNWWRVLDGCLIPRRTGQLTVGRNIILTFDFVFGEKFRSVQFV
jgi:hypothetical protein